MSPQALRANKFALMPSNNDNFINFIQSTFLFVQRLMYLITVKNSKICCSIWHLYFLGSVVSSLIAKLLSKLVFAFTVLVYHG